MTRAATERSRQGAADGNCPEPRKPQTPSEHKPTEIGLEPMTGNPETPTWEPGNPACYQIRRERSPNLSTSARTPSVQALIGETWAK
eukprot:9306644-Pyramimonas_sp.AAC.1